MHSFRTIGLVGVVWVLWGYSLAFGPDQWRVIGNLEWIGLRGGQRHRSRSLFGHRSPGYYAMA